ncbi:MAG TPA: arylsulfotransferase family protein [Conexibacter sp.]|jgi:hypothetical protein
MKRRTPAIAAVLALAATAVPAATAHATTVSVYPSPGSHTVETGAQVSLRGVAPSAAGPIEVTGSVSGSHAGRLEAHSDGDGASFVPDTPFTAGETVTVDTGLDVTGAANGDYSFTVATPGLALKPGPNLKPILSGRGVQKFHTEPGLVPPKISVRAHTKSAAPGDIFLGDFSAPREHGPGQIGPMVLNSAGKLIWYKPLATGQLALDVKVQKYQGRPVLTWWQGWNNVGLGNGVGVIYNSAYRQIATVRGGNGLAIDPHEFLLTNHGTALVESANPVVYDLSAEGGSSRATVFDGVIQEIDLKTGLVEFEWHSLDHVAPSASHTPAPRGDGHLDDYFHMNSLAEIDKGHLLVSARNTWAVYKIDMASGNVDWQLGGTNSSFRAARGATFSWQHDARVAPNGTITVFDDGPSPDADNQSRALGLRVDTKARTVKVAHDFRHAPKQLANSQGNQQTLPNGDNFVGWGSQPVITEFSPSGRVVFDALFPRGGESYRAYRFPWTPAPTTKPKAVASRSGATTTVYVSWNGADVSRWRVLAGKDAGHLSMVTTAARSDFETKIAVKTTRPFVQLQALSAACKVLGSSAATKVK